MEELRSKCQDVSSLGNCSNLGASVIFTWAYAEIAPLVAPIIPRNFRDKCPWEDLCRWHLWRWNTMLCECCSVPFFVLKNCPSPEARIAACNFAGVLQIRRSSDGKSIKFAKWTVLPSSLDGWHLTFYLTFFTWHVVAVCNFSHDLFTASSASGIFKTSCTERGLCTQPQWKLPSYPSTAMCSIFCRSTFSHAPLFSESDCSSLLHLPEVSLGFHPSLCTALREQCLSSNFRRTSTITLK